MSEKRQPLDWVLFLTLTCLWASAYVFNRISVNQDDPTAGLPPQMVIAGIELPSEKITERSDRDNDTARTIYIRTDDPSVHYEKM